MRRDSSNPTLPEKLRSASDTRFFQYARGQFVQSITEEIARVSNAITAKEEIRPAFNFHKQEAFLPGVIALTMPEKLASLDNPTFDLPAYKAKLMALLNGLNQLDFFSDSKEFVKVIRELLLVADINLSIFREHGTQVVGTKLPLALTAQRVTDYLKKPQPVAAQQSAAVSPGQAAVLGRISRRFSGFDFPKLRRLLVMAIIKDIENPIATASRKQLMRDFEYELVNYQEIDSDMKRFGIIEVFFQFERDRTYSARVINETLGREAGFENLTQFREVVRELKFDFKTLKKAVLHQMEALKAHLVKGLRDTQSEDQGQRNSAFMNAVKKLQTELTTLDSETNAGKNKIAQITLYLTNELRGSRGVFCTSCGEGRSEPEKKESAEAFARQFPYNREVGAAIVAEKPAGVANLAEKSLFAADDDADAPKPLERKDTMPYPGPSEAASSAPEGGGPSTSPKGPGTK